RPGSGPTAADHAERRGELLAGDLRAVPAIEPVQQAGTAGLPAASFRRPDVRRGVVADQQQHPLVHDREARASTGSPSAAGTPRPHRPPPTPHRQPPVEASKPPRRPAPTFSRSSSLPPLLISNWV